MDHALAVTATAVTTLATATTLGVSWIVRRRTGRWWLLPSLAGAALALSVATTALVIVDRSSGPPARAGSVSLTAGTGSSGCLIDVEGTADVPEGRALWLFLVN